jgi:hypothetical protein
MACRWMTLGAGALTALIVLLPRSHAAAQPPVHEVQIVASKFHYEPARSDVAPLDRLESGRIWESGGAAPGYS